MYLTEAVLLLAASGEPPGLLPARQQMAVSLGWHIVLASFGVAFPTIIFVVHRRGLVRDDAVALGLARRWAKVSAVLFAIGAVSGTVLSFEMGLLWPGLMGRFGDVLGLPFAFEGLSFFVEAIFLGIYLYGWDRMPPRRHLMMLIPMGIAGIVGTFCVISVNAWMNHPAGFSIRNGDVVDINPWAAMFNEGVWLQFLHMWVAAFMVVGLTVSGVYAVGMLRGRIDHHHKLGFTVPFAFASVAAVAQPFIGHVLGMLIHDAQPAKLAAFELAQTTEGPAPLRLGGVLIDGEVRWALTIPRLGSIIARNSWDAPVPGLEDIPESEWPPVNITHLAFQSMVGIGTLLAGVALVYWLARWRGHDLLGNRWFLRWSAITGPLAIVAVESGWIATEVGRQPWTVWQVLTTVDAASESSGLWWSYIAVLVGYTAMTVGAVVVLRSMAKRWRAGDTDLPSPYGPPRAETVP
ncbi:cytochrome ubiquinol oxidase subunit I [Mycolicibacterium doricum]|uniref:Cytochrome BD ubiquinol oxidase subunit I n=1 Tax=Mycolicibacterium doricum TaxID=126673 RepID=A0A1X1SXZ5_9MYCO|nr:cytochrome ubiquinol oxidase subunit I [Mycolicibacterium doricum]MCV7269023.1 cytochrome ubiquinol oxidase subunit I [Mycolicibacterium doricum]ORV36045.1 cytochrome BD ubiquinol oxidase subunit I [Mycolicibacterium doricum]BBZ07009.1 cytochrome ubiquinol oxidase subunit I [Mycolicibacterium doricum]